MNSSKKPKPQVGLKRVWNAFFYSLSGFKLAFRDEAAFRQELLLTAVLTVVCLILPFEPVLKIILISSHVFILVVELINTAVESIVDLASPEFHLDAKKAKDTGSSAVLLSLILSAGIWIYAVSTL